MFILFTGWENISKSHLSTSLRTSSAESLRASELNLSRSNPQVLDYLPTAIPHIPNHLYTLGTLIRGLTPSPVGKGNMHVDGRAFGTLLSLQTRLYHRIYFHLFSSKQSLNLHHERPNCLKQLDLVYIVGICPGNIAQVLFDQWKLHVIVKQKSGCPNLLEVALI